MLPQIRDDSGNNEYLSYQDLPTWRHNSSVLRLMTTDPPLESCRPDSRQPEKAGKPDGDRSQQQQAGG